MGFWEEKMALWQELSSLGQDLPFGLDALHDFYQSFVEGDRWLRYLSGMGTTLQLTFAALLLGVLLGVLLAVVRTMYDQQNGAKRNPILGFFNRICHIYITVIRGTPVMVQLLIAYFVIFAGTRNQLGVAILAFGVNSGAYVGEIIRAGIMSIDKGQMEAGRSLGLGYVPTMRHIIIPQAIKNILPALGNEFITLFKETSIVTVIGLVDLTKVAIQIQAQVYQAMMPLLGVALMYLVCVMIMTWLLNRLERRLRNSDH